MKPRVSKRTGIGLVLRNPGGGVGWLARGIFPGAAGRAYLLYKRLVRARANRLRIGEFLSAPSLPWFTHVEIETLNRCNGDCSFCPVNRHADPRPPAKMAASLFEDILDQLASIGYSGFLGLFSNNEPLLDSRLEAFLESARRKLPGCFLNLSTNGSLLSRTRLDAILPFLDRLVINNYSDRAALSDNLAEMAAYLRSPAGKALLDGKTVEMNLRSARDVLSSRGGSAPNRAPPAKPPGVPCALPFSQFIVRPDGKVGLCCNDALGRTTLGDLSRQSVAEVWRGDAASAARLAMAREGRAALPLCRVCDFVKDRVD